MQESFGFVTCDIARWRQLLTASFGSLSDPPRRQPIGQLVKSLISSRTRDAVSLGAYRRLGRRWPHARELANATPSVIEQAIFDVTFADKKALYLPAALRMIGTEHPDFRLDFLGEIPVDDALAWLECLPGVGRKVAAATLNASTLGRRVFIVDSHVYRVLARLGFIAGTATPRTASERVTASAPFLDADDLLVLFAHMKRLGQTICRFDTPMCAQCPLNGCCRAAASPGAAQDGPVAVMQSQPAFC